MTKYQDDIGRKMTKALESELLEGFCLQSEASMVNIDAFYVVEKDNLKKTF